MHPSTEAIYPAALLALVDAALKGLVLLALAALVTLCLRRASAAARHLTWSVAVAGLWLLPVFSFVLPQWRTPWLPDWHRSLPLPPAPSVVASTPDLAPVLAMVETTSKSSTPPESLTVTPDSSASASPVPSPLPAPTPAAPLQKARPEMQKSAPAVSWADVRAIFIQRGWLLWLMGVIFALMPLGTGWWQVRRLTRTSQVVTEAAWLELLGQLAGELGLRRRVQLRRGLAGSMPLTWGAWRPVLLLPADAGDWPAARRRIVLLHELGHIKRWDWLTQTLAYLACALYWFNPLAWLAARRMRIEREQACDDLVLACGSTPADYADELLRLATSLRAPGMTNFVAVPMARRSSLEGRLLAILDPRRSRATLTRFVVGVALALVVAIAAPIAMLRAAPGSPPEAPIPPTPKTASGHVSTPDSTIASTAPEAPLPTLAVSASKEEFKNPESMFIIYDKKTKALALLSGTKVETQKDGVIHARQATFEHDDFHLSADDLAYDDNKNEIQGDGHVWMWDGQGDTARIATADHAELHLGHSLTLTGHVQVSGTSDHVRVEGEQVVLNFSGSFIEAVPARTVTSTLPEQNKPTEQSVPSTLSPPLPLPSPTFAQLTYQQLAQKLETVRQRYQVGLATAQEFQTAQGDLEIAQAELNGDPVAIAQAKVSAAERHLTLSRQMFDNGLLTFAEVQQDQAQMAQAQANLSEAQAAAVKNSTVPDTLQSVRQSIRSAVNAAPASSVNSVVDAPGPQISIQAEFLSVPADIKMDWANLDYDQLERQKGVELLSSPRITVLPKVEAVLSVAQELRLPEGNYQPTPAGVVLHVIAAPAADDKIEYSVRATFSQLEKTSGSDTQHSVSTSSTEVVSTGTAARGQPVILDLGHALERQMVPAPPGAGDPAAKPTEGTIIKQRLAVLKFDLLPAVEADPASSSSAGPIKALLVTGDAQVKNAHGELSPLTRNQVLAEGDSVLTGATGGVVLVFSNGSALQVRPNTELQVVKFSQELLDRQNGTNTVIRLNTDPGKSTTMLVLLDGSLSQVGFKWAQGQSDFNRTASESPVPAGSTTPPPNPNFIVLTRNGPVDLRDGGYTITRNAATGEVTVVKDDTGTAAKIPKAPTTPGAGWMPITPGTESIEIKGAISSGSPSLSATVNGVTVELVGMGYYPTNRPPNWRPDGVALPSPLFDGNDSDIRSRRSADEHGVTAYFKITGLRQGTVSDSAFSVTQDGYWTGRIFKDNVLQPDIRGVALSVPIAATTADFYVSVEPDGKLTLRYVLQNEAPGQAPPALPAAPDVFTLKFANVALFPGRSTKPSLTSVRTLMNSSPSKPAASASPNSPPPAATDGWGEPLEGFSARLRPAKLTVGADDIPSLVVDVRNLGQRVDLSVSRPVIKGDLIVDGIVHKNMAITISNLEYLRPGQAVEDLRLMLSGWAGLKLSPGKHVVQFLALATPDNTNSRAMALSIPSNPVEIEILPNGPGPTQPADSPPAAVVTINGEVLHPGKFDLPPDKPLTVTEAIQAAGGFTSQADRARVGAYRTEIGPPRMGRTFAVNVAEMMTQGDYANDTVLMPGDRIDVPKLEPGVLVTGAVPHHASISLPPDGNLTASAAIKQAGGFTEHADPADITLERVNTAGVITKQSINLAAVLHDHPEQDVLLQAGDRLVVNEAHITITGAVKRPADFKLWNNFSLGDGPDKMTVFDAIMFQGGGFSDGADQANVTLVRRDAEGQTTNISLNLEDARKLGGSKNDLILEPTDQIKVNFLPVK